MVLPSYKQLANAIKQLRHKFSKYFWKQKIVKLLLTTDVKLL